MLKHILIGWFVQAECQECLRNGDNEELEGCDHLKNKAIKTGKLD